MKRDQHHKNFLLFLFALCFLLFGIAASAQSLKLNGTSQYGRINHNAALALKTFTIEMWIKRDATGTVFANGSGTGGVLNAIPLLTKGVGESESATVDVNYFIAIRSTDNKIGVDFEDDVNSTNHPVFSNGTITADCKWHHLAVSFNDTTGDWKIWIDGAVDLTTNIGLFHPRTASLVNVSFGTGVNSTNVANGFFSGSMDEIRIWNRVRTDAEIVAGKSLQITNDPNLAARYGLDEGTGTTANNSAGIGSTLNATLFGTPTWNTGVAGKGSLDFDGVNDYVTFGAAPSLNSTAGNPSFTLEAWIKIEGAGVTTSTGSSGLENATAAVPIVAKGRSESDAANLNCNYFLGITAGNVLAADFEDEASGLNHPVIGNTILQANIWNHVAATYDQPTGTWKLFVNGVLDQTLSVTGNPTPEMGTTQHASIGSALNSTGVAAGFFNGKIDEVRIWNVVRSEAQISTNYMNEIETGTGLIGRWNMADGCGTSLLNTGSAASVNGTLTNGVVLSPNNFNPAPFNPTNPNPPDGMVGWPGAIVNVDVADRNGQPLTVKLFGRKKNASAVPNFTIIGLPDTQFYTEQPQGANSSGGGHNGILKAQTQWVADHRIDSNIKFVVQLGDCVQNGNSNEIEWKRADTAWKTVENPSVPIPDGMPYSICVGNHDQGATGTGNPNDPTTFYNQYFGESRFLGRGYYGGHYGTNNDNSYQLFSAGGIDFISFTIEYNDNSDATEQATLQGVLNWVDSLLKVHSNRKAILSSHWIMGTGLNTAFQGPGQKIYDDLKDNPNLILMLCGHVAGQGRRSDLFGSTTIHTLMSDYQSGFTNGGNGYLRIMQFKPASNTVSVKTYSPYANAFLSNADGQAAFDLAVDLSPGFVEIATDVTNSGTTADLYWSTIQTNTEYEWYVTVSDGENIITSPIRSFTSGGIIPVRLMDFNAKVENNQVKLTWNTASESNSKQFDVERSRDGKQFTKISSVNAKGNSNSQQHYTDLDVSPFRGVSYYRLKQMDLNGGFIYSPIERVNIFAKGIEIFPNPVTGSEININFLDDIKGRIDLKVYDVNGKIRMSRTSSINSNNLVLRHNLTPGIYIVKIRTDEQEFSKKIVIK
jgi:concanavalin A-like lectin/glucanase superfamily protein/type IX secretion system substrate protein/calcineurin-like phosphoesterase family protein